MATASAAALSCCLSCTPYSLFLRGKKPHLTQPLLQGAYSWILNPIPIGNARNTSRRLSDFLISKALAPKSSFFDWFRMSSNRQTEKWYGPDTVAVVTGANKGIGYEIVKGLLAAGLSVVLTARDVGRGIAAVEKLQPLLSSTGSSLEPKPFFHQLEVTNGDSVAALASWLETTFGKIDILVNNAGVYWEDSDLESAREVFSINYFGVITTTRMLLPLLKNSSSHGSRVVIVSSRSGYLHTIGVESIRRRFLEASHYKDVDAIVEEYLAAMASGTLSFREWNQGGDPQHTTYNISKAALLAFTRLLSRDLMLEQEGEEKGRVYVSAMCPGYCATDMTAWAASARSAKAGAETAVWLALMSAEEAVKANGKFYADKTELYWDKISEIYLTDVTIR